MKSNEKLDWYPDLPFTPGPDLTLRVGKVLTPSAWKNFRWLFFSLLMISTLISLHWIDSYRMAEKHLSDRSVTGLEHPHKGPGNPLQSDLPTGLNLHLGNIGALPFGTENEQYPKLIADDPDNPSASGIKKRNNINLDQLVYFEKLVKERVRAVHHDGSCSVFPFEEIMLNIQEQRNYEIIQPVPRDGQVTEYVNLHYIEYFEKVVCGSKESYRARLSVGKVHCGALRRINDHGVGLFSLYVYSKLRHLMEQLNPHVDYKYRRTIDMESRDY